MQHAYKSWNRNIYSKAYLTYTLETFLPYPENKNSNMATSQYTSITKLSHRDHPADILKVTSWKFNWLLPMHMSSVLQTFELDIQSQTKCSVRIPRNPTCPPDDFQSDIGENQKASVDSHRRKRLIQCTCPYPHPDPPHFPPRITSLVGYNKPN